MAALMSELPQERLTIALHSIASAQKAFDITKATFWNEGVRQGRRDVPEHPLQAGRSRNRPPGRLGLCRPMLEPAYPRRAHHLLRHRPQGLTTEMHGRLVDQCLQFFGGYGFMREYEICRLFADARVLRIYGGTSEIMRELISRNS